MEQTERIQRIERALEALSPLESKCRLCPRQCGVNRRQDEKGVCQTGVQAGVSHALLHFGEEPVLSGTEDCFRDDPGIVLSPRGSGTIFFSGCNLKCLFCQNYQLSWLNEGAAATDEELAAMMLSLQDQGALNINFVSPTHVILPILRALRLAYAGGLKLPLVYNSNGYDSLGVLKYLEGIVDIYLPDIKYYSPRISKAYSEAADYFERMAPAVREMSAQQPVLSLGPDGTARRGLIIRHLVLPGHGHDSREILRWIKTNLSPFIGLSLMSQYHPCYQAPKDIRRPLTASEYRSVTALALELGFENLFIQPDPFSAGEHLVPDFSKKKPFSWKSGPKDKAD